MAVFPAAVEPEQHMQRGRVAAGRQPRGRGRPPSRQSQRPGPRRHGGRAPESAAGAAGAPLPPPAAGAQLLSRGRRLPGTQVQGGHRASGGLS